MQLLEYFYELSPQNYIYFDRKLQLFPEISFVLSGARGVGKTTMVLEYLKNIPEESWLYIDCQDPIFALEDIDALTLEKFIAQEEIATLVLDHYYEGFLESVPETTQLIIISRELLHHSEFEQYVLYPLDYEEFLSMDKSSSPANSYNHFLKVGTLPVVSKVSLPAFSQTMRSFFYANFDEDESRLMLILAKYQGHRISINQLYKYARDSFRISKDWIYRTIKHFIDEGLVIFIEDVESRGASKMLLYDFALSKYLSKSQPFPVTFDAMTALALAKHQIAFKTLGIHGYLIHQNELIVPSAFEGEDSFWKKSYNKIPIYKKHKLEKITIVTVSNHYEFILNGIKFEALPFYEWSILNEAP